MNISKPSSMQSVGDILIKFNPLEDKYISREFQAYGYHLAEVLNDLKHRSLYMKLAKTLPRAILEKALSYVKDADVKNKGALFMWKLKELGAWDKKIKNQKSTHSTGSGLMLSGVEASKIKKRKKKVKDIPF